MKVLTYKIGIRECDSCVGTVLDDIGLKISSVTYFFLSSVMQSKHPVSDCYTGKGGVACPEGFEGFASLVGKLGRLRMAWEGLAFEATKKRKPHLLVFYLETLS